MTTEPNTWSRISLAIRDMIKIVDKNWIRSMIRSFYSISINFLILMIILWLWKIHIRIFTCQRTTYLQLTLKWFMKVCVYMCVGTNIYMYTCMQRERKKINTVKCKHWYIWIHDIWELFVLVLQLFCKSEILSIDFDVLRALWVFVSQIPSTGPSLKND